MWVGQYREAVKCEDMKLTFHRRLSTVQQWSDLENCDAQSLSACLTNQIDTTVLRASVFRLQDDTVSDLHKTKAK